MSTLAKSLRLGSPSPSARKFVATQRTASRSYAAQPYGRPSSALPRNRADLRRSEQNTDEARQMERNAPRDWKIGDVYAPHDLSAAEARKWKKRVTPTTDAFDALSLNPLDLYKNFSVMSEYVTQMGRIRGSKSTGLRPVNQRKIAKAIRRAIALGLMPSVHKHPEIIRKQLEDTAQVRAAFAN